MSNAFDKIAAGLEDAIAYASGDSSRGREAVIDVKSIRSASKKTRHGFASAYHIPVGTVRDWEQGRRSPDAGSRTLLKMIDADPIGVEKIMAKIDA